jgi:parallel beta-helix repeat protein
MDGPFASTVINVKDHGAIGDGSADDTHAIRAVIDASREGDAIYFPPGTYLICGRLLPKAHQKYFSLTHAATIKAVAGSEWFSVFDVRAGRVEFDHLIVDLSGTVEPPNDRKKPPPPAIRARAVDGGKVELVVTSCRIEHAPGQGILVAGSTGSDRVTVGDSLVADCGESGLTLDTVDGARVERCRFERCRNGVQASSCRDVTVYAVTATHNRRHGFAFRYSQQWHVGDCIATGNGGAETDRDKLRGWGIAAGGGPEIRHPPPNSDFTILNNICEGNYAGGITLDPTVADDPDTKPDETAVIWTQRARIAGNVCRGRMGGERRDGDQPFGTHGIHVRNSSDVVVTDNHCYLNHSCGIAVVNASHVLVQANACYENTIGIGVFNRDDMPEAGRHLIDANVLYDNDEADLKGLR